MLAPTVLQNDKVRLEPLTLEHVDGLVDVVKDGDLWEINITSTPTVAGCKAYIEKALAMTDRVPFAVMDKSTNKMIGTTSYHDILPDVKRLEIGYTFYGQSHWRTHVNTTCKYLLMQHAFETLNYAVIGWRTDNLNTRSQNAIARLGAKKDGVIRGNKLRKDGSIRDTVMYSMSKEEWIIAKENLLLKL